MPSAEYSRRPHAPTAHEFVHACTTASIGVFCGFLPAPPLLRLSRVCKVDEGHFDLQKRHLLRIGRPEGFKRRAQVRYAARGERGSAAIGRGNVLTLVFLMVFVVSSLCRSLQDLSQFSLVTVASKHSHGRDGATAKGGRKPQRPDHCE